MIDPFRDVYQMELFRIGETPVTISTLVTLVVLLVVSAVFARFTKRAAHRLLIRYGVEARHAGGVTALLHYGLLIVGAAVALHVAGIDLSALFAAGAFLAVGLGLAMQSISQNFVSGVILLSERSIKPGDILEVEHEVVKVIDMGIRASMVRNRDGEDIIVPDSVLSQSSVRNFTLNDPLHRIRIPVGVTYGSDMKKVQEVLDGVASELQHELVGPRGIEKLRDHVPGAYMVGFGSSSVDFEVCVWSDEPWEVLPRRARIHRAIWFALKNANIVIAFPQLDVHLDPDVVARLGALDRNPNVFAPASTTGEA